MHNLGVTTTAPPPSRLDNLRARHESRLSAIAAIIAAIAEGQEEMEYGDGAEAGADWARTLLRGAGVSDIHIHAADRYAADRYAHAAREQAARDADFAAALADSHRPPRRP